MSADKRTPLPTGGRITKSDLRDRGWTQKMIETFLPDPDETARNPKYRCADPMKLYNNERVMALESSPAWAAADEAASPRRAAARKAVRTKYEKTEQRLAELDRPKLEAEPLEVVQRRAYRHWACRRADIGKETEPREMIDAETIARITVNHLRHEQTSYDQYLREFRGAVGAESARDEVRERVMSQISQTYPELADEVERQRRRRIEQQFADAMRPPY